MTGRKYSPDAGMAGVLMQAHLDEGREKYEGLLDDKELLTLTDAECRQLWLARREERRRAQAQTPKKSKSGRPAQLPATAEKEIRKRIKRGETRIAAAVAKLYPGVMKPRAWQAHVRILRNAHKPKT